MIVYQIRPKPRDPAGNEGVVWFLSRWVIGYAPAMKEARRLRNLRRLRIEVLEVEIDPARLTRAALVSLLNGDPLSGQDLPGVTYDVVAGAFPATCRRCKGTGFRDKRSSSEGA